MQVEDENVPDEALHMVPRRFAKLSQKLAAKFQAITQASGAIGGMLGKSGLGGQVALAAEQWLQKKKPVPAWLGIASHYHKILRHQSCLRNSV